MLTLGVVGSPNKAGLSSQLVDQALAGAASCGSQVRRLDLIDYDIPSFPRSAKKRYDEIDELVAEADAMVIGSPVYYKDVSGLVREFIDYLHSGPKSEKMPGEPALGMCVAGGSGMGQITALRSLHGFFFFRHLRPIDPIPVSRFSFRVALKEAYAGGQQVARMAPSRRPFKDLAEKITHFCRLKYLRFDIVDEIIMLAGQMLDSSEMEQLVLDKCRSSMKEARALRNQGRRDEAIHYAVEVYETLFH